MRLDKRAVYGAHMIYKVSLRVEKNEQPMETIGSAKFEYKRWMRRQRHSGVRVRRKRRLAVISLLNIHNTTKTRRRRYPFSLQTLSSCKCLQNVIIREVRSKFVPSDKLNIVIGVTSPKTYALTESSSCRRRVLMYSTDSNQRRKLDPTITLS